MSLFYVHSPIEDRLYSKQEVARLLNISESSLERLAGGPTGFPRPIKVTRQAEPMWAGVALACWLYNAPAAGTPDGGEEKT